MTSRFAQLATPALLVTLGTATTPAAAAALDLKVELPRVSSAEYHRPYVAIWVEGTGITPRTLAVWYDANSHEEGGRNWLAEMRQWWRKTGRTMTFPADGISGATRAAGPQRVSFPASHPALADLPPGDYVLGIEAAREKGGEETVKVPFTWPPKAPTTTDAKGSSELGAASVTVNP